MIKKESLMIWRLLKRLIVYILILHAVMMNLYFLVINRLKINYIYYLMIKMVKLIYQLKGMGIQQQKKKN